MRCYIIGSGVIARTHVQAIYSMKGSFDSIDLRIADVNSDALKAFVQEYPEAEPYTAPDVMLAEPSLPDDIVIIATPPFTHKNLVMQALASGRHVLCEKPLAMNLAEAEEMTAAAEQAGVLLGCCSMRFSGSELIKIARELVQDGKIGELYQVSFVQKVRRGRSGIEYQPQSRWFLDRSKAGGGTLFDWGPYDFALLNELLQWKTVEVKGAWAVAPRTQVDPDALMNVEFHVGASIKAASQQGESYWINYERSSCTHGEEMKLLQLEGTKGAISFSPYWGGNEIRVTVDRDGQPVETIITAEESNPIDPMHKPIIFFTKAVMGQESPALLQSEALFVYKVMSSLYETALNGESAIIKR